MQAEDAELLSVLCALAGARRGDAVAVVGAPERAARALLAAGGTLTASAARVVLAGPGREAEAREALAPGGRLVALAADDAGARRAAADLGLTLRHAVPVGAGVAWVAVAP